jgi:hypothetical protein
MLSAASKALSFVIVEKIHTIKTDVHVGRVGRIEPWSSLEQIIIINKENTKQFPRGIS